MNYFLSFNCLFNLNVPCYNNLNFVLVSKLCSMNNIPYSLNVYYLGIQPVPQITDYSKEVEVVEGSSVTIQCSTIGAEDATITWFKDDEPLEESPRFTTDFDEGLCLLRIERVSLEDEADYKCQIENESGITSMTTELIVEESVSMPIIKEPLSSFQVIERSIARFDVRVAGYPIPVVEWFKDGQQLEDMGRVIIIDDVDDKEPELFSLVIEDCKPEDTGEYKCIAMNEAGKADSACVLTISPLEERPGLTDIDETSVDIDETSVDIVETPVDIVETPVDIAEGQDLTLKVEITGSPRPEIEWYKDDKPIADVEPYKIEQKEDEYFLTITEATPNDEGVYKCISKTDDETIARSFRVAVEGIYITADYVILMLIIVFEIFRLILLFLFRNVL